MHHIVVNYCHLTKVCSGCAAVPWQPGEEQKTILSVIPIYHIYGLAVNTLHTLLYGAKVVIMPKFEPGTFLASMAKHQPTHLNIVPPLVTFLALSPAVQREVHLAKLTCIASGGSPLSSQVLQLLLPLLVSCLQIVTATRAKLGFCELKEGYGMTETSGGVTRTRVDMEERHRGTVGTLIAGTEARVEDPATGQLVGVGVPGELVVRGPQVRHKHK